MTEHDLRNVITAYNEGSFLAASRKLFVSQSALSQSIRKLEKQLGATLFINSGNHVKPTKLCHQIVARGNRVLAVWDSFEVDVRHFLTESLPGFCILAPTGILLSAVLPVLGPFQEIYPDVDIRLMEKSKSSIYEHLNQNPEDLGFVPDSHPGNTFQMIPVFTTQYYLAVPDSHPYAKAHPFRGFERIETACLSDFKNESFAVPAENYTSFKAFMLLFEEAGFKPKAVFESYFPSALRGYVNAGKALTLVNSYVAKRQFDSENISYYAIDLPGSIRTVYACHSKEVPLSPIQEELIKKITACQKDMQ